MRYLLVLALCLPLCAQEVSVTTHMVQEKVLHHIISDDFDRTVLAKPKQDRTDEAITAEARRHGLKDKTKTKLLKWKQFEVPPGKSKKHVIKSLQQSGLFEAVQENRIYRTQDSVPNDPFFSQLWGMTNIAAPAAWDLTREAPNVIVAVVDTGIDFTHVDLVNNLWTGQNGEHGYTVLNGVVTPGGVDDHGHGTHCAGTIAGVGNNALGVAGVAWKAKIMAIKVLHGGSGSSTDIAIGIEKLVELKQSGYPIVASNHSYGGFGEDEMMRDAFALLDQSDIFAAVASGNSNLNIDSVSFVPAVYPFGNLISTMASGPANEKAFFSNLGWVRCHIAAPGMNILSTTRSNTFSSWNGTSMAAPHVCGVALLVRARNPSLSAREVKDLILEPNSYDGFDKLANNNTSARINLNKTLRNPRLFESPFKLNRAPSISGVTPYTVVTNQAVISYTTSDPDSDPVRSTVTSSGSLLANDFTGFFRSLLAKNAFAFIAGNNNVTIVSKPFAYQLAGALTAVVSDSRGGGASMPTGFEVAKLNSLKRTISVKTWTVRTNATFGHISWVFDVNDPVKSDYSYILSWTAGIGTGSWFGFQPGTNEQSANINVDLSKFSIRVFVMDKYFNWLNSEPIVFPSNSITFPKCIATASTVEGNAPFEVVFDLSASTGPITHRFVTEFFSGGVSVNSPIITNIFTDPIVHLARPLVLSTVTRESDGIIIPIFSSRFAEISLTNKPPTEPPVITNLLSVTNLTLTALTLTASGSSSATVILNWSDRSSNEDRYIVEASYKSKGWASPWFTVATLGPNQDFFVHMPDERKATWTYRVKACAGQICAPNSNLASVRVR